MNEINELNKIIDDKISSFVNLNYDINEEIIEEKIFELEKKMIKYYFDNKIKTKRGFTIFKNMISDINQINFAYVINNRAKELKKVIVNYID